MAANAKIARASIIRAKITSKGQITVPVAIRKSLGVRSGDTIRFELSSGKIHLARDIGENPFEKWRGIGSFPGMGNGKNAVRYFRDLRGHDGPDHDGLD